jgi:hypothetical protein
MQSKRLCKLCGRQFVVSDLVWALFVLIALGAALYVDMQERADDLELSRQPIDLARTDLDDWTPKHVSEWLESVGLGEFAPAFVAEGIDGDAVTEVDIHMLERLGVHDAQTQATFLSAVKKMQREKVNDMNPTANGFWEYRAAHRQFVGAALPGLAVS